MKEEKFQLKTILWSAVKNGASDVHFSEGHRPTLRVNGELKALETKVIEKKHLDVLIKTLLPKEEKQTHFKEKRNLDGVYDPRSTDAFQMDPLLRIETWKESEPPDQQQNFNEEQILNHIDDKLKEYRFRINAGFASGAPYITIRIIPNKIRDIRDIGFPSDVWEDIIKLKRGLVLVTGETGSGKTTTLASLIQEIGRTRGDKIISIEDPIEYVHPSYSDDPTYKGMVIQRELGRDVNSFNDGVTFALRQDPDVILVGEIRDPETGREALKAAETGHLVLSTLHTKSADQTVIRYLDMFGPDEQNNIRGGLAANLAYVICQELVPTSQEYIDMVNSIPQYDNERRKTNIKPVGGRVLAMEIMNVTSAIQGHIRNNREEQIKSSIQSGKIYKMITMDNHLLTLASEGKILNETAISYAHDVKYVMERIEHKQKKKYN